MFGCERRCFGGKKSPAPIHLIAEDPRENSDVSAERI